VIERQYTLNRELASQNRWVVGVVLCLVLLGITLLSSAFEQPVNMDNIRLLGGALGLVGLLGVSLLFRIRITGFTALSIPACIGTLVLLFTFLRNQNPEASTPGKFDAFPLVVIMLGYAVFMRLYFWATAAALMSFTVLYVALYFAMVTGAGTSRVAVAVAEDVGYFCLTVLVFVVFSYQHEHAERSDFLSASKLSLEHAVVYRQTRQLVNDLRKFKERDLTKIPTPHTTSTGELDLTAPVQEIRDRLDLVVKVLPPASQGLVGQIKSLLQESSLYVPDIAVQLKDAQVDAQTTAYLLAFSSTSRNGAAAGSGAGAGAGAGAVTPTTPRKGGLTAPGAGEPGALRPSRKKESQESLAASEAGAAATAGSAEPAALLTLAPILSDDEGGSTTDDTTSMATTAELQLILATELPSSVRNTDPVIARYTWTDDMLGPLRGRHSLLYRERAMPSRMMRNRRFSVAPGAEAKLSAAGLGSPGGGGGGGGRRPSNPLAPVREVDLAEVENHLSRASSWEFDIFAFSKASADYPISYLGQCIFERLDLATTLNVSPVTFLNFCRKVDAGYRDLAFHNNKHGADVAQAMFHFLTECGLANNLSKPEVAACIIGSIIHDLDHPGTTNAFHIATQSDIALTYSDRAVLESFHLSRGISIMANEPGCNILGGLPLAEAKGLRRFMTELVLATDMGSHFEIMGNCSNKIESGPGLDLTEAADRVLLGRLAIKCADISNPARPLLIHRHWTAAYIEETFAQGDRERELGLPISPFMDRTKPEVPKVEVGFFDFIVIPMWRIYAQAFQKPDNLNEPLKNLQKNLAYWKQEKEERLTVVETLKDFQ
jgi:hypothetical protein